VAEARALIVMSEEEEGDTDAIEEVLLAADAIAEVLAAAELELEARVVCVALLQADADGVGDGDEKGVVPLVEVAVAVPVAVGEVTAETDISTLLEDVVERERSVEGEGVEVAEEETESTPEAVGLAVEDRDGVALSEAKADELIAGEAVAWEGVGVNDGAPVAERKDDGEELQEVREDLDSRGEAEAELEVDRERPEEREKELEPEKVRVGRAEELWRGDAVLEPDSVEAAELDRETSAVTVLQLEALGAAEKDGEAVEDAMSEEEGVAVEVAEGKGVSELTPVGCGAEGVTL
jgi:hypothetical protein